MENSWSFNKTLYLSSFCIEQVMNLQAQLASLKEQAARSVSNASTSENPNPRFCGKLPVHAQDWQSWLHQLQNQDIPRYDHIHHSSTPPTDPYHETGFPHSSNYENAAISEENASYVGYVEAHQYSMPCLEMETSNGQWTLNDTDALHSIAFRYPHNSWGFRYQFGEKMQLSWKMNNCFPIFWFSSIASFQVCQA